VSAASTHRITCAQHSKHSSKQMRPHKKRPPLAPRLLPKTDEFSPIKTFHMRVHSPQHHRHPVVSSVNLRRSPKNLKVERLLYFRSLRTASGRVLCWNVLSHVFERRSCCTHVRLIRMIKSQARLLTGDNRGYLYWLGTLGYTQTFSNPHEAGRVRVTSSGMAVGTEATLTARIRCANTLDYTYLCPCIELSFVMHYAQARVRRLTYLTASCVSTWAAIAQWSLHISLFATATRCRSTISPPFVLKASMHKHKRMHRVCNVMKTHTCVCAVGWT
jgi:hypothetical protein